MKLKKVYFIVLLFFIVSLNQYVKSQNNVFKAGAAITNITPNLGVKVVGNFNSPGVDYIHDEIHVRTLVLTDGNDTLTFSIVDNVGIPRELWDAAKKSATYLYGIPYKNMMMSADHDHSAPSARGVPSDRYVGYLDEYQRFLVNRIVDGIGIALKNLEPAQIGWGGVNIPEHVFSRRYIMKEPVMGPLGFKDIVQMNPGVGNKNAVREEGPVDPEVSFLAVKSVNGRPIALLANYSLHYVGGVPDNHISSDYFGAFADRIQELLKADRQDPPFVGIMSNGTSGNVNNINVLHGDTAKLHPAGTDVWSVMDIHDEYNVNLGETGGVLNKPYERIRVISNDIAQKVFAVYNTLEFKDQVKLNASITELKVGQRRPSPEIIANAKKVFSRPEDAEPLFHPYERIFLGRAMSYNNPELPDFFNVPVQTFQIGDLGIAAIPFEAFAKIGLEIKAKSPFKKTFTIGLANGSYGYLPTPDQFKLGGYETWLGSTKVAEETSDLLVERIIQQFRELKK